MIKTGLPYAMDKMQEIQNDGAIVDMNNLNFVNIPADKQKRTVLIFLRNTGFNVTLDFENCSYEDKAEFLKLYMTENIRVKNLEFASTWIKILNYAVNIHEEIQSFLSDEEIEKFINNNKELVKEVFQLILSLPIYAVYKFAINNQGFDTSEFPKTDKDIIKCNIYNLFTYNGFLVYYEIDTSEIPRLFYTKLFTQENNELFEVMEHLPFMTILFGLATTSKDDWKRILDGLGGEIYNLNTEDKQDEDTGSSDN